MIFVLKFMVHSALSDENNLLLGLLSPLRTNGQNLTKLYNAFILTRPRSIGFLPVICNKAMALG